MKSFDTDLLVSIVLMLSGVALMFFGFLIEKSIADLIVGIITAILAIPYFTHKKEND